METAVPATNRKRRGRLALIATGIALALWLAVELAIVGWFWGGVEHYGGRVEWKRWFPPEVAVSFRAGEGLYPANDLEPVLKSLRWWGAVRELRIRSVHAAELRAIGTISQLKKLSLSVSDFADEAWPALAGLASLEHLTLESVDLTPAAREAIRDSKRLKILTLEYCGLRRAGIGFVAELPELTAVRYSQWSDKRLELADAEALGSVPRLGVLIILGPLLAPGALAALGNAQFLDTLVIGTTSLGTDDLAPLAKLPRLKTLMIEGSQMTDDVLATLAHAPVIETLAISQNQIDADGLEVLRTLPKLKQLRVDENLNEAARRAFGGGVRLEGKYWGPLKSDFK